MDTIPRNIILDLLPVYVAGEASRETIDLVESVAGRDPEIARLIQAEGAAPVVMSPDVAAPDDLETQTIKATCSTIRRRMMLVALVTAGILLVPLVAMTFTSQVNWSAADFIAMGALLFGAGLAYVLVSRVVDRVVYRTAVGIAVLAGVLLVWLNLAVGIIAAPDHPANLLYAGVLAIVIGGAGIARFSAGAMAHVLFAAAFAQSLVPLVALFAWRPAMSEPPGIAGVFLINACFAALFVISALLFRRANH